MKKTKNKKITLKELQEILIETGLRIAKRGEGALFVVGEISYKPLIEQKVPSFKINENSKLLESLAMIDGAVIIKPDGFLEAYGVMIKTTKTIKNFGTRHSAAISAAKNDNLVVLVSEEDKKIKILQKGKMIMQIDALQKNVEKSVPQMVDILESVGAGAIGVVGASVLAPTVGIALLPGIVVFGSAYYLAKLLTSRFR
ncbi:MAG: DNA integrity scanning protein DisA nucleotide-binding domain protein [archaeon]